MNAICSINCRSDRFTIYDSAAAYQLHFAGRLSQIVVQIPRMMLKEHFATPETLTARPVRGGEGVAQITTNFAISTFRQSLLLDDASQDQVAKTLIELLATSIRKSADMPARQPKSRAMQLIRIKQFIDGRLNDPDLTPKLIAAAHSITVRYLQMLFASEGVSPNKYIIEQRLDRAKQDLADPRLGHRSVSEICFAWAFNDAAHFSRSFKSKFGVSPRAFRQNACHSRPAADK